MTPQFRCGGAGSFVVWRLLLYTRLMRADWYLGPYLAVVLLCNAHSISVLFFWVRWSCHAVIAQYRVVDAAGKAPFLIPRHELLI